MRALSLLATSARALLDLLLPRQCICCGQPLLSQEPLLCLACLQQLPNLLSPPSPLLLDLRQRMESFAPVGSCHALLPFVHGEAGQRLMHALKYGGRPEVGEALAGWYAADLAADLQRQGSSPALITCVPLHARREARRGYNQCHGFCRELGGVLGLAFRPELLLRMRSTAKQTTLARPQRWENVSGAFALAAGADLQGAEVLLVDDTATTGATLGACTRLLLAAGAGKVHVLSMALAV